jgi:nucleoporin NUP42
MRVEHYLAVAAGRPQEAVRLYLSSLTFNKGLHLIQINKAQGLVNDAENQMRVALNDLDGATKYITNAQNEHPNRIDICRLANSGPLSNSQPTPFLNSSSTAMATQSDPFAGPTSSTTSGFGTQSQAATTSAFGQPASLGARPSPFGQPSQLGQKASPFGQPSQLGQRPSPFGQPSLPNSQQSNPFAQTATASSPFTAAPNHTTFGSTTQPVGPSVFGQPSQPVGGNIFGQTGKQSATTTFGASNSSKANPFARIDISTGGNTAPNPFRKPPAQEALLGSAHTSNSIPLASGDSGQGPLVGTLTANAQGFGNPGSNPNPFPIDVTNPNGPNASHSHPNITEYSVRDSGNKLFSWKSKPVTFVENEPYFKGDDGKLERIWFPNGPPTYSAATEPPVEDISAQDLEGHQFLLEHSTFKDGIMPSVAPQREYCRWDF